jgi:phage tail-like protein
MLEQLMRFSSNPLFRFIVLVDGSPLGAFTQCTLPEITWEMTTVQEGGLNTYVHQLPGPRQAASITLKNGVAMGPDMLAWYISCMQEVYWRRAVTVTLLNSLHIPVMTWHIEKCIPKKWAGPQMQTGDNTVAVQTLELACGLITAIPTPFVPT